MGAVYTPDPRIQALWEDYTDQGRPVGSWAEDQLARHYLPYATQVAERYHRRVGNAVERDDLVQNGYLGLIEALRTFDPEKANFQTYANRQIQWKIAEGLRGGDWLPRPRRENVRRVRDALAEVIQAHPDLDQDGLDAAVSRRCGLDLAEVRTAYEDYNVAQVQSLTDQGPQDSSGQPQSDFLDHFHDRSSDPTDEQGMATAERSEMLAAMRTLPERDQQILALYYWENFTLMEIAEVFSVDYSRISQLLKRATVTMRTNLELSTTG